MILDNLLFFKKHPNGKSESQTIYLDLNPTTNEVDFLYSYLHLFTDS